MIRSLRGPRLSVLPALVAWMGPAGLLLGALIAFAGATTPVVAAEEPMTVLTLDARIGYPEHARFNQYFVTPANSTMTFEASLDHVTVFATFGGHRWTVLVGAPDGEELAPGVYEGAVTPPTLGGEPRLLVEEDPPYGVACTAVGRFVIDEFSYDAATDTLLSIAARFESWCTDLPSVYITGELRVNSMVDLTAATVPDRVEFPDLIVGEQADLPITITNAGSGSTTRASMPAPSSSSRPTQTVRSWRASCSVLARAAPGRSKVTRASRRVTPFAPFGCCPWAILPTVLSSATSSGCSCARSPADVATRGSVRRRA